MKDNRLKQTVDALVEVVEGMASDLRHAVSRIEAIERRQEKLACSDCSAVAGDDGGNGTGPNERGEYEQLAEMLGIDTTGGMWTIEDATSAINGFFEYEPGDRLIEAMLIGLACEECNGTINERDGDWEWDLWDRKEGWSNDTGESSSRPAAAIAMLKAYRESNNE